MSRNYHGKKGTPIYRTYHSMLQRCTNTKCKEYPDYGGRGIKVCDRWSGSDGFLNFMEDMGDRPDGKTIDRIDNDMGYSPENCRWATWVEQMRNKRKKPNTSSLTKGVSWNKFAGKWQANIKVERKQLHLGYFMLEEDAIRARLKAEAKYFM